MYCNCHGREVHAQTGAICLGPWSGLINPLVGDNVRTNRDLGAGVNHGPGALPRTTPSVAIQGPIDVSDRVYSVRLEFDPEREDTLRMIRRCAQSTVNADRQSDQKPETRTSLIAHAESRPLVCRDGTCKHESTAGRRIIWQLSNETHRACAGAFFPSGVRLHDVPRPWAVAECPFGGPSRLAKV